MSKARFIRLVKRDTRKPSEKISELGRQILDQQLAGQSLVNRVHVFDAHTLELRPQQRSDWQPATAVRHGDDDSVDPVRRHQSLDIGRRTNDTRD